LELLRRFGCLNGKYTRKKDGWLGVSALFSSRYLLQRDFVRLLKNCLVNKTHRTFKKCVALEFFHSQDIIIKQNYILNVDKIDISNFKCTVRFVKKSMSNIGGLPVLGEAGFRMLICQISGFR